MQKYKVNVRYQFTCDKEIIVYEGDEEAAKERAVEIVSSWRNVEDVTATSSEVC